jgi:hypothetical protein
MKNTQRVTLPAVEVEIPRMGLVVYVSEKIGVQDNKWTCMFTAEIASPEKDAPAGTIEIQSFHLKCKSEREAKATRDRMAKQLTDGPYPFIQHGV